MDQSQLSNNLNTEKGIQVDVQMLNTKRRTDYISAAGESEEDYICTGWTCEPARQYKSAVQKRCWIRYRR